MLQEALIPSGCQGWRTGIVGVGGGYFAYCSTLSLYVFSLMDKRLVRVITGHSKMITALAWCKISPNIVATTSLDRTVRVWNLSSGRQIGDMDTEHHEPTCIEWSNDSDTVFATASSMGVLRIWEYPTRSFTPVNLNVSGSISLIRWNLQRNVIAVGTSGGLVLIFNTRSRKTDTTIKPGNDADKKGVEDVQWDPCSQNYLLIAWKSGHLGLFDVESGNELQVFDRVAGGVRRVQWIPGEPGNFLTADNRSGMLRFWNVSLKNAQKNAKAEDAGFVDFTLGNSGEKVAPCAFNNGVVKLYDISRGNFTFVSEPGHTETIFDCKFSPSDCNILATAAYDGFLKFWDVSTLKCVKSMGSTNCVIYCVSWDPESSRIAGGLSTGEVVFWDWEKGIEMTRIKHHKDAVFRVAYSPLRAGVLASCSRDGSCVIFRENGIVLRVYKHSKPLFGCSWHPTKKELVAVGCFDGYVRVYDVSISGDVAVRTFKGHTSAVYNVEWNPLVPSLLASSSNDNTVRIWNLDDGSHVELRGHSDNVRALLWCPVIPSVIFSGSWDGSMRCWDVRNGNELFAAHDHCADVYGLAAHDKRPFLLASSSRDTTLRLWTAEMVCKPAKLRLLLHKDIDSLFMEPNVCMEKTIGTALCGDSFKELLKNIHAGKDNIARLKLICDYFRIPSGTSSLFELASSQIHGVELPPTSSHFFYRYILPACEGRAREMEASTTERLRGVGSVHKDEKKKNAAAIWLKCGNFQRYCEHLVEIGCWEEALAAAPAVSHQFWRDLCAKRALSLMNEGDYKAVPLLLASGHYAELSEFLTRRGEHEDAFLVATAYSNQPETSNCEEVASVPKSTEPPTVTDTMRKIQESHAIECFNRSLPIFAACAFLVIGDSDRAIRCLLRGNETDLAWSIAKIYGSKAQTTQRAVLQLAFRCEAAGELVLARDVLGQSESPVFNVEMMCARSSSSNPEKLYVDCGLRDAESYAKEELSKERTLDRLRLLVVSRKYGEAWDLALSKIIFITGQSAGWQYDIIDSIFVLVRNINPSSLDDEKRNTFLALMHFNCGLKASWYRLYEIAAYSFSCCRKKVKKMSTPDTFPIALPLIMLYEAKALSHFANEKSYSLLKETENLACGDLLEEVKRLVTSPRQGAYYARKGIGEFLIPTSGNLPSVDSHGRFASSFITKQELTGPFYSLEDNITNFSISEAAFLARYNPFSPIKPGIRIQPY